ncbi:SDR family oxidoreductase [Candidatus Woesearchaeota archaeon]|nr:SDR family oxidoreductase [Candidatus Woesearchaeota archaeon]MCF8013078.1 SDR family oxidoreductase [Candidatus Woesearchaeota archaeon]
MEINNKTILVTGGSRGIGAAICKLFAKNGAKVVVCYKNNKNLAELVVKECQNDSFSLQLDVSDNTSILNAVDFLKEKKVIPDILINNAGVLSWNYFEKQTFERIEEEVKVNFLGVMKTTLAFLSFMKEKSEAIIVNTGSVAAKHLPEEAVSYASTKAAVKTFTKALAKELPGNIKIYNISPGLTSTDMTEYEGVSPEKVANVFFKVCTKEIKINSGEDIDVRDYY